MTYNRNRQIISEFCDLANSGGVPMTCFGNDKGGVSVLFDGKFVNLPPVVARITTMKVPLMDEPQNIRPIKYTDLIGTLFWNIEYIGLPTRIENVLKGYTLECFDKVEFVGDLIYIFKRLPNIPNLGKESILAARRILKRLNLPYPESYLRDWPRYREDYVQGASQRASRGDVKRAMETMEVRR